MPAQENIINLVLDWQGQHLRRAIDVFCAQRLTLPQKSKQEGKQIPF